jgi:hypothetical protein
VVTFRAAPMNRPRVRASASAVLWLTLFVTMAILSAALLAGGSAGVPVMWLFDRKASLVNGEANVVKFTLFMTGCALGSVAACFATAFIVWNLSRLRAWLTGIGTAAGFWGTMALLGPRGIQSRNDVYALCAVVVILGLAAGLWFSRMLGRVENNDP